MGEVTTLSQTWSATGRFTGDPYLTSLRGKDPKRTSTTTMHNAMYANGANERVQSVHSLHLGPGVKVTGGRVGFCYEDRCEGRITVPRSMDPAEILRTYRHLGAPPSKSSNFDSLRASTALAPTTATSTMRPNASNSVGPNGKVIFFDGLRHHVMDKEEGSGDDWKPPHLKHADIEKGRLVGVRETGTSANTKLIGSKFRLMEEPSNGNPYGTAYTGSLFKSLPRDSASFGPIPPPYTCNQGPYGLKPYAPVEITSFYGDLATLRATGRNSLIGHKQYEKTCKTLA